MSVEAFMVGFHSRLDKISKLDMDDDLKSHLLLNQANQDSHDRNLDVGAAGADYALQALATCLRNAFCSEGLPPSSITSASILYRRLRKSIPSNDNGNAQRHTRVKHISEASTLDGLLFFTILSSDNTNYVPDAIIVSGSCCLEFGRKTFI